MKSYDKIEEEFEPVRAQFAVDFPKPVKNYIAYNNGKVLNTVSIVEARAFSPKGLIETIDPDPNAVRKWRQGQSDIQNQITAAWKAGMFAENDLPQDACDKILSYAFEHADSHDEQCEMFGELVAMVESILPLINIR